MACVSPPPAPDEEAEEEKTNGEVSVSFTQSDVSSDWADECVEAGGGVRVERGGEGARMLKLRRNSHQLDSLLAQRELSVLQAREELRVCCLRVSELQGEREALEEMIDREKQEEDSVGVFRLRAQHKCVCEELHREEELQTAISMALREHELELCQVEVQMAGVCEERGELKEPEEKHLLTTSRAKQKAVDTQRQAAQLQALEQTRNTQHRTSGYIQDTINRIQRMEAEKEEKNREEVKRRTEAVLALKNSIAASQEVLRVQRARARAQAQRSSRQEEQQVEALRVNGSNATRELHQQRQLHQLQHRKEEFEEKQKARRLEIISKLLQEEELMEKRKQREAPPTTVAPPKGAERTMGNRGTFEKILQKLEPLISDAEEHRPTPPPTQPQRPVLRGMSDSSSDQSSEEEGEGADTSGDEEEEEDSGSDKSLTEPGCTLEELAVPAPERERPPLVHRRVQAPLLQKRTRKGFKGPPFISKPGLIHFKDFDVGKVYRKRIVLTNITYATNYCRLLGLSTNLMDFISLSFLPPGPMSPGMACEMEAVFKPVVDEDLEGEVCFSSAAGNFSVPVKCTTKKCQMEVDSRLIDFGSHVVGQTISRIITLSNRGARPTRYCLPLTPSSNHTPEHTPSHASSSSTKMAVSRDESVEQESPLQQPSACREEMQNPESPDKHSGGSSAVVCVSVCGEEEVCADSPSEQDQQDQQESSPLSTHTHTHTSSEFQLPQVREGGVGPFSSTRIRITFNPTIPGDAHLDFLITFSEPDCPPISVRVSGTAVSAPVCVTETDLDLKICSYGRLYQHCITVQSRANTALRLMFHVCKELREHMEVLPKTGYVQAQSSFQAQLRFLPRRSLAEDAGRFFDKETGVLEVPLSVQVADQVRPLSLVVHAVLTAVELQCEPRQLLFGHCTVQESVRLRLRLTNPSLLPQDFGFVRLPKFLAVQPGDGFGTLLPRETLELDVIFSPQTPGDYSFQLTCRSGTNRDVCVRCEAVGVLPALELSQTLVELRATAVGGCSHASLYVLNTHTSAGPHTHTPPCAGHAPPTPIGPRRFAFCPPDTPHLTLTPTSGRVLPGQRCLVQVTFSPSLSEDIIKAEAARLLAAKQQQAAELSSSLDTPTQQSKKAKKPPANRSSGKKNSKVALSPKAESPPELPSTHQGSEELGPAVESLLLSFKDTHQRFTIPCFISDGDDCTYSPHTILYVELRCPVVRPPLLLRPHSSDITQQHSATALHYQQVLLDEKVVKRVMVQNISEENLDLTSSVLDLSGPFLLINALRSLRPGDTHTLLLAFTPTQEKKYTEVLALRCSRMTLELCLHGEGVRPLVTCAHEGPIMDFGYVLENDTASQVIKLHNDSILAVRFTAFLANPPETQQLSIEQSASVETTQNTSPTTDGSAAGRCVFLVCPAEGVIPAGKSADVTVSFQPDQPGLPYSDKLTIQLSNKQTVCALDLKGAARHNIMYLCGGDPLDEHSNLADSTDVLLTLRGNGGVASRSLEVGCIRTSQPVTKKTVEFVWENVPALKQKGFNVEPLKGTVEAGGRRCLTVTWAPPRGTLLEEVVEVTAPLTLKGNETEVYSVTLQAFPPQTHTHSS